MTTLAVDFTVIKNEQGEVQGLSLIAQPQTEAQIFCETFRKAFEDGSARIKFEDGKIVFYHTSCFFSAKYTHEICHEDMNALIRLFNGGHRLDLDKDGFLTQGFKLVLA